MIIFDDNEVRTLDKLCNIFELTAIMAILFLSFAFQIIFHELPCPLCLYQRLGFFGIALGFLLNLRFGFKPSHYSVVILSALFTSFVSLRQIALHVVPGTGSYGDPVFGYHLYTWSFIISMVVLASTTLMMGFDRQYKRARYHHGQFKTVIKVLFALIIVLLGLNVVSVYLECGFKTCPENPTGYR